MKAEKAFLEKEAELKYGKVAWVFWRRHRIAA